MKLGSIWQARWIAFDYAYLLPFLAHVPVPLGRFLAILRGRLYARWSRDWRQFSFRDEALRERTRQTYMELRPQANAAEIERLIRKRYIMQSLEELEAAWVACRNLNCWPVEYIGLEPVLEALKIHGRLVFVTSHFSSSIVGTIHLRRLGIPIMGMSSNVVEDPRVHPAIGRFYREKYAAMDAYLLGGKILDRQGNSREFVKFLKKGGAVVIVGDLPPDPHEQALQTSFFGKLRGFAPGPSRMANIVKAPLLSYVCEYTSKGYKVTFSEPGNNPYALMEKHIRKDPSAWWAADLLPLLPLGQKNDN